MRRHGMALSLMPMLLRTLVAMTAVLLGWRHGMAEAFSLAPTVRPLSPLARRSGRVRHDSDEDYTGSGILAQTKAEAMKGVVADDPEIKQLKKELEAADADPEDPLNAKGAYGKLKKVTAYAHVNGPQVKKIYAEAYGLGSQAGANAGYNAGWADGQQFGGFGSFGGGYGGYNGGGFGTDPFSSAMSQASNVDDSSSSDDALRAAEEVNARNIAKNIEEQKNRAKAAMLTMAQGGDGDTIGSAPDTYKPEGGELKSDDDPNCVPGTYDEETGGCQHRTDVENAERAGGSTVPDETID